MANDRHLLVLNQGIEAWNEWRETAPEPAPDLSGLELRRTDFRGGSFARTKFDHSDLDGSNFDECDLAGASFEKANLSGVGLSRTNLALANFTGARLVQSRFALSNCSGARFINANLTNAYFINANIGDADMSDAKLFGTNLTGARLVGTNLTNAVLRDCAIYGVSAWDLRLENTVQEDLRVTPVGHPAVAVDNLEVAQFVYLLLGSEKIREVIDTVAKKAVLILGRFTPRRKAVLDAIRQALRQKGYVPLLFDFERPIGRDLTETIVTLAHMARFIIADITDAKSIPQELQAIVPTLPSVPVQPILLKSQSEYGMFKGIKRYPWVLATFLYKDQKDLLQALNARVISPLEQALVRDK